MVGRARDLAFTRPDAEPRSFLQALAQTGLLAALVLLIEPRPLHPPIRPARDGQATQSLNLAFNAAACGRPGYVSERYTVAEYVAAHPELQQRSVRGAVRSEAGSLTTYCGTLIQPVVHNENTLSLIMEALFRLHPDLSLVGLGTALTWLRLALWLIFAAVLAWSGASLAASAFAIFAGSRVLGTIGYELSGYPFLLVLPPLFAARYGAAARSGRIGGVGRRVIFAFLAGGPHGPGRRPANQLPPDRRVVLFRLVADRGAARRRFEGRSPFGVRVVGGRYSRVRCRRRLGASRHHVPQPAAGFRRPHEQLVSPDCARSGARVREPRQRVRFQLGYLEWLLLGVVIGLVYKPPAAASARRPGA